VATAWIALATGVLAAVVSGVVALRQAALAERLTRLTHELESEERAQEVLKRYEGPLAAAAFDLQGRLYNILRLDFFTKYKGSDARAEEGLNTTLFRLGQYFGWSEILRRDIQFLSFPDDETTRRVGRLQSEIAERFLTDEPGSALMLWRDEQRAIGERMIVEEHGTVLCMGYAAFLDRREEVFGHWHDRLRTELRDEVALARLGEIQPLLCELVEALDPGHIRYTNHLERV
jgi:hypothetical protein